MSEQTLLRVGEFAASLRITPACVRRWIREKKVTVVKLGRLVRIPATEVGRIVTAGTRPAAGTRSSDK
jgi:excisionase family DNA binding protein